MPESNFEQHATVVKKMTHTIENHVHVRSVACIHMVFACFLHYDCMLLKVIFWYYWWHIKT